MLNRVLLVDDSKSARFALRKLLERKGLEVDVAESAEQALGYLEDNHPDVIFMDHLMPGMDGFQATQQIKRTEARADIPVIMCTSKEDPDYVDQARAHGALDILPKPATPEALQTLLERLSTLEASNESIAPDAPATESVDSEEALLRGAYEEAAGSIIEADFGQPVQGTTESVEVGEFGILENEATAQQAEQPAEKRVETTVTESAPREEVVTSTQPEITNKPQTSAPQLSEAEINSLVSDQLAEQLPQLRQKILSEFDRVAKSILDGYMQQAINSAKHEFLQNVETKSKEVADQSVTVKIETLMQGQLEKVREDLRKEVNSQLADIYSTVGEIKSNQQLKKLSPELEQMILSMGRESAQELAAETRDRSVKAAKEACEGLITKEMEPAVEELHASVDSKLSEALEQGLGSVRKEAQEVAWKEQSDFQNKMNTSLSKLYFVVGITAVSALAAVAGVGMLLFQ